MIRFQNPRGVLGLLAAVAAIGSTSSARGSAETQPASRAAAPLVSAVDGVEVVVADLARSRPFFESIGFVFEREDDLTGKLQDQRTGLRDVHVRRVQLRLGSERLALLQYLTPTSARPVPLDTRGNDLWFQHIAIVVSDMDRAFSWLRSRHVGYVSSGPQTLPRWNHAAAGIQAFYFADPDGHTLEVIHFPSGKGNPRWQTRASCDRRPAELCVFLGIDHTAITVSDTEQSLAFYRDRLGLTVAGESENYGPEQEHLNGVFGARLRITSLHALKGPGIELLQYLSPRGGRPMPNDARVNDLFHWQIVISASDGAAFANAALATGGQRVGQAPAGEALVRDRDGHALFAHELPAFGRNVESAGSAL
ncbi:MAG TPA: VOC family protein [Polyangiaceae bacterium]|nr:VOC family protein [Polyangiaceae bacterium]